MASTPSAAAFIVWGIDQTAYGPVELPALISWVKDRTVSPDTWIFATTTRSWQKAAQLPELVPFFRPKSADGEALLEATTHLAPHVLRRIKILACMSDDQLDRFAEFVIMEKIPQLAVARQGDHGDAMYLILEGEFRVCRNVMGKETTLATLGTGEFFGDIALFNQGPRSADVVANTDSTVLKITSSAFEQLAEEAPDLATPFLLAIGRTLTARIRADNRRVSDSARFARAAS